MANAQQKEAALEEATQTSVESPKVQSKEPVKIEDTEAIDTIPVDLKSTGYQKLVQFLDQPEKLILSSKQIDKPAFVKCLRARGLWYKMTRAYLAYNKDDFERSLSDYYVKENTGFVFTDVTFLVKKLHVEGTEEVEHGLCGVSGGNEYSDYEKTGRYTVGYMEGKQVHGAQMNPSNDYTTIKYNKDKQVFEDMQGREIIGAELVVLTKDCQAMVANPKYKNG